MRQMPGAEVQRLSNTVIWSLQGFAAARASEKTLRQWVLVNAGSDLLAFGLDLTAGQRALIVAPGLLVLAAELVNTAVDEVVD